MEPSARQRSRKGCLPCRQKRKKCDEIKPVCGRCTGNDDCIWPAAQSTTRTTSSLPRIKPRPLLGPKPAGRITRVAPTSASEKPASKSYPNKSSVESSNLFPEVGVGSSPYAFSTYPFIDSTPVTPYSSDPLLELDIPLPTPTPSTIGTQEYPLELRSGYRPPAFSTSAFAYIGEGEPNHALDEDEEETFKTAEWLEGTLRLLGLYLPLDLPNPVQVQWSSALDSYFTFFIRYSYDPSNLPVYMYDFIGRHGQIESVRLATLSTSLLLYSFLNPGLPRAPLWGHANELIGAAADALRFEEAQPNTTLSAQLAGISEILGFYYFVGDLGGYVRYIEKALPIVQKLVGTTPVSIHELYGPETLDIRMFAWCDVFGAMATSRPARLVYDCNVDPLLKRNQEGPSSPFLDTGLEWMCGLPDAFLLLTIQILNLKHSSISPAERIAQATAIEAALRGWKVWPSDTPSSVMRIQRVSAQEIWRHSTILYLYQAVYRATPGHAVVQQSVKQIIKLASALRPGRNPDCLLYIPYFLAGTFAISAKDRQFIRSRVMRCGVDAHMRTLVIALDELWEKSLDRYIDWTSRNPPLVMF